MSRSKTVKCKDLDLCCLYTRVGAQISIHSFAYFLFDKFSLSKEEKKFLHIVLFLFILVAVEIILSKGYF